MSVRQVDEVLAERVRKGRASRFLSQREAAEMVGVSERTWQGWESGTTPRPSHRRALEAFLAEREAA